VGSELHASHTAWLSHASRRNGPHAKYEDSSMVSSSLGAALHGLGTACAARYTTAAWCDTYHLKSGTTSQLSTGYFIHIPT
jgi:hypothetical protein